MSSEPEVGTLPIRHACLYICVRCESHVPHDRCMACVLGGGKYSNLNAELKQDLLSIVSRPVLLEPGM